MLGTKNQRKRVDGPQTNWSILLWHAGQWSSLRHSLSKDDLNEGDLLELFSVPDANQSPVLAKLKETLATKYAGN